MLVTSNISTSNSSFFNYSVKVQKNACSGYELSNHLGNVLAVITDRRIQTCGMGDVMHYEAQVVSISDYYPFGMGIKDREWKDSTFSYRFGFNGKEKDNEVNGDGNCYDFGARIYDSRLGRFFSLDHLAVFYPSNSDYSFALSNPILFIDIDGNKVVLNEGGASVSELKTLMETAFSKKVTIITEVIDGDIHLKMKFTEGNSIDKLTEKEMAVYKVLESLTESPDYTLSVNLESSTKIGQWDNYDKSNLYTNVVQDLPDDGYIDKLYALNHFFIEQGIKAKGREKFEIVGYGIAHSSTLNQEKEVFGYTLENAVAKIVGDKVIVQDFDIVDKQGNYLATVREDFRGEKAEYSYFTRKGQEVGKKVEIREEKKDYNITEDSLKYYSENPIETKTSDD